MGFTKQELLDLLRDLQIDFEKYEHPVVLTVEAQAKYVGDKKGALSKNLFLKDKKNRFFIVSALAETKVDLKVLSQRLGLGKGGLRMAPEEALAEILQVPLGCVTPFAVKNESASHVSLLLDQGFRTQDCCFFHPLSNDMTIALSARDLDKFLNSIEKAPVYIDLEASPTVGKDQPPDLAAYVPSDTKILDVAPEIKGSMEKNNFSINGPTTVVTAKKVEKPTNASKEKTPSNLERQITFADTDKFVEEILAKTSSLLLYKLKEEDTIETYREQLAINMKQLGLELKNVATMFKNLAYSEGFSSGVHSQTKRM